MTLLRGALGPVADLLDLSFEIAEAVGVLLDRRLSAARAAGR